MNEERVKILGGATDTGSYRKTEGPAQLLQPSYTAMRKHPGDAVIPLGVAGLFILFGFLFSSKESVTIPVASPSQISVQADADTLEQVWMKPTKTTEVLQHVMCEEPLENCFAKSQEKILLLSLTLIRAHRREDRARPVSKVHL